MSIFARTAYEEVVPKSPAPGHFSLRPELPVSPLFLKPSSFTGFPLGRFRMWWLRTFGKLGVREFFFLLGTVPGYQPALLPPLSDIRSPSFVFSLKPS